MAEFTEFIKKGPNLQNEIWQTIDGYNKESFSAISQKSQNALLQSKVFEQSINIMGKTLSHMDIEINQKGNKIKFLKDKTGKPVSKTVEKMNRLDLNKI